MQIRIPPTLSPTTCPTATNSETTTFFAMSPSSFSSSVAGGPGRHAFMTMMMPTDNKNNNDEMTTSNTSPSSIAGATGGSESTATNNHRNNSLSTSVVVIGGGFAGLAAARTLLQQQQQQPDTTTMTVTLLEAKDRLGGRLHSVSLATTATAKDDDHHETNNNVDNVNDDHDHSADFWGDMGGMFWHGNSTVFQSLAQDFPHLESIPTGGDSKIPARDSATWLRYPLEVVEEEKGKEKDSDNVNDKDASESNNNMVLRPQPVTHKEVRRSQELYELWEDAMHQRYQKEYCININHDNNASSTTTPITTATTTNEEAEQTSQLLASWSKDFIDTLDCPLDRALLQLRLTLSFEMDRGTPWQNHTLSSLDQDWDWIDLPGDDHIARRGMKSWVDALAADIQNMGGIILLNQRVESIDYRGGGGGINNNNNCNTSHKNCTVQTEQGGVFYADYVVVALPLGVLKARAEQLFTPPLPAVQMDALDRAGVGVLNTLLIRWDRELKFSPNIGRSDDGDDDNGGNDQSSSSSNAYYFLQSKHTENPLRHGFCCPGHLRQAPRQGDSSRSSIDSQSPTTITQFHFSETDHPFDDLEYWKAQAVQIVQDVIAPNEEPLTVDNILVAHVSDWHLDPDIRGSYSAATTRTRGNTDRRLLGLPVGGQRVFFAGEHTHTNGRYQSIDGAYETGLRAADEILQARMEAKFSAVSKLVAPPPNSLGTNGGPFPTLVATGRA